MVTKTPFLGHSFISRLVSFNNLRNHHSVDMNLGLDRTMEHILYKGYSGGYLIDMHTKGLNYVENCKSDIVLLQIGSNDLCKKSNSVRDVARGIIELSMLLQYKYKVKQVIVCPILHCLPPKRPINYAVDVDWFNGRCDELNVYLDSYFKDDNMENVMFWRHSGFWSPDSKASTYIDDGVHLNNQDGYLKYYRSVRAAVVTARKTCSQLCRSVL